MPAVLTAHCCVVVAKFCVVLLGRFPTMETRSVNNLKLGSDSQDSEDLHPPGTSSYERSVIKFSTKGSKSGKHVPPSKGVENAKKRLRAFSIQKKSSLSPVSVPKPVSSGAGATVYIGKLSSVKTAPKPEPDPAAELKKLLKPPKPGAGKLLQESYIITQKKTLAEIEDMKRKMELVELGIPLGLICPAPNSDKAMPTKAMPPIKTFLDAKKVDELIREAKKARAEGREFKFDYHKLLPDYDNPFQRKRDEASEGKPEQDPSKMREDEIHRRNENIKSHARKVLSYNFKQGDKFRHREDKYKEKPKEKDDRFKDIERVKDKDVKVRNKEFKPKLRDSKSRDRDVRSKDRDYRSKERAQKKETYKNDPQKTEIEAEVNLKDFVVCDSWSDNEDKSRDSTPKQEEKQKPAEEVPTLVASKVDPMEQLRQSLGKKDKESENLKPKMERLNPVIDSFKFEIEDPDDDDVLDVYEDLSTVDNFSAMKAIKEESYDSPIDMKLFEDLKDVTFDEMADDTFLESVINEIKQEELDETSQDKGLVEYDESPREDEIRESVTPEMDDRVRELHSSRSDYSDGLKSLESGYKSTDSLKLSESYKSDSEVVETHVEERKMAKYTEDSLETWSFVLKICQPLLFRHDKNKCYKETRIAPKVWYTENPKLCSCVKDRRVVYKELEMCKMELVDSLYGGERVQESAYPTARGWYPHPSLCLVGSSTVSLSSEWEAEDSQPEQRLAMPGRSGDISLDKEYQRFMEAVWPEVTEPISETPHSTPVRHEPNKQDDGDQDIEKRKTKKLKRSSEGWSQESEVEAEIEKSYNALQDYLLEALHFNFNPVIANKKVKADKQKRKRKLSTSASVTDSSETEAKKRKKMLKKKDGTKSKSKEAKRRHVIKKSIKKLKDKQKKKKKLIKLHEELELQDLEKEKKKKEKKIKKKKQLKEKKRNQKKKKAKAKSSSSDTSTDSEAEQERKSKKKRKKSSEKKKKRKDSTSESTQEELFDVNILNNIKTERVTDDEMKQLEFSPRRQKPREIINVKELQNDFVGNSIQIKQEVEEQMPVEEESSREEKDVEVAAAEKEEGSQTSAADLMENVVKVKEKHISEFEEQEENQSTPRQQFGMDESNLSQLRPDESSQSQHRRDESSVSQRRPGEFSLSQLRPDESSLSQLRSGDSSLSQIRPDQSSLSRHRLDESYLSQLRSGDSNLSLIRLDESNVSQIRPVESNLSHLRPDESSLSQLRPDESSLSQVRPDESNLSQCSSQESIYSLKDQPLYEKDDSHLRPSSQNSNYSFHDVMASGMYSKSIEHGMEQHDMQQERHGRDMQSRELDMQSREHEMQSHGHDMQRHDDDLDSQENYEQGDYEMYEHMAMAYQSDVASQRTSPPTWGGERRIETVVRSRTCGEIKCDWRAGDSRAKPPPRPSRWGLKPGEVNIVLTGGTEQFPIRNVVEPVYKIQSIANRTDNSNTGYDEAYMDMYGASDKLQYGDCFSTVASVAEADPRRATIAKQTSSLDDRISLALRTTVLGDVAKDVNETDDKDGADKGILVTKSLAIPEGRGVKRVSFADGYKPGQDSDVEEPPVKKRKKARRVGTAWPCPASHPDHVPLWDALPPPPPPRGSPPPPPAPAPPPPALHLLRHPRLQGGLLPTPPHAGMHKFDPNSMPAFMPPEPPPGLISFQNL